MAAKLGPQWVFVVAASLLAVAVSSTTQAAEQDVVQAAEQDSVAVTLGYASQPYKLKTAKPFKTAIPGDLKVIDLLPLGDRSIGIVPQGVGKTNIVFLDETNAPIMDLNVLVTKTRSDYTDYVESRDKAKISALLPTGHTSSDLTSLGSGLIDYSQKMKIAAIQIADMKVCAHRS